MRVNGRLVIGPPTNEILSSAIFRRPSIERCDVKASCLTYGSRAVRFRRDARALTRSEPDGALDRTPSLRATPGGIARDFSPSIANAPPLHELRPGAEARRKRAPREGPCAQRGSARPERG